MLAGTDGSYHMNNSEIPERASDIFMKAFCPNCYVKPDAHNENFCWSEKSCSDLNPIFLSLKINGGQKEMLTFFLGCVYFFPLIYFSSQNNTGRTVTLKTMFVSPLQPPVFKWCSFFFLTELNKNRRKLFEPPIRSSFLEGGASGRLSRQFHADMASISGRW